MEGRNGGGMGGGSLWARAAVALTGIAALAMVSLASTDLPTAALARANAANTTRENAANTNGAFIPAPGQTARPSIIRGTNRTTSLNWAGYVETGPADTFTAVTDTWNVPTVTVGGGKQYSSDWVGIGGYTDQELVQAGTEADNLKGTASYKAWTEILPAAEDPLALVVSPGDSITVEVAEKAANEWLMQVTDNTTQQSQQRTVSYVSSGASVEAIHERPCLDTCSSSKDLTNLATTTNVTFDPGSYSTSVVGTTAAFTPLLVPAPAASVTLNELVMVKGKKVLATPSAPDAADDGFTVADGKTAPPPP
ncbi:MAG TPA: G1 family glutamic endopeptidase [Acidimicrobiales bacterium]|nr:G1 family glutamic endopeptidase [Acidimicrobiales bacterium]